MRPKWVPDPGWTGDWALPEAVQRPLSEKERGMLVAMSCGGMGPARLASALSGASSVADVAGPLGERWRDALAHLRKLGARAVVPFDDEYPSVLREIAAPPVLLFVKGRPIADLMPAVAVVGSRACTSGARRFAEKLGDAIAASGFGVVSGLARGIDGAAHEGALDAGATIGVLGCGIDIVYPAEHRALAERIIRAGALVSEFPPGIGPRAWHFPARNRILSGLSIALIVVEAGLGSGALITAGFATDQGRDVYACITGPENPAGGGVRSMIKDGAHVIVDAEQAVEDLVVLARAQGYDIRDRRPVFTAGDDPDLRGPQARVYDAVTDDTSVEDIAAVTSLPAARVAAVLTELELDGAVWSKAGRWSRTTVS
jgi:DNA processing protein